MLDYVKRMIQEKEDLEGKIRKAQKALDGNPFGITCEEKNLLETQVGYMTQYLYVLEKRIEIAKNK